MMFFMWIVPSLLSVTTAKFSCSIPEKFDEENGVLKENFLKSLGSSDTGGMKLHEFFFENA